jgi:hypothetical protein
MTAKKTTAKNLNGNNPRHKKWTTARLQGRKGKRVTYTPLKENKIILPWHSALPPDAVGSA